MSDVIPESRLLRSETQNARNTPPGFLYFLVKLQALAQERLESYRLHVEQAREEIEALQVSPLHSRKTTTKHTNNRLSGKIPQEYVN